MKTRRLAPILRALKSRPNTYLEGAMLQLGLPPPVWREDAEIVKTVRIQRGELPP